jgi:hypothetical protein
MLNSFQLKIKQKVDFCQLLNRPLLSLHKPNDHSQKNIDLPMESHMHVRTNNQIEILIL